MADAKRALVIDFKAKGAPNLIKAINRLAKAQKKLDGTQTKNAETQKLLTHRVSANTRAVHANSTALTKAQSVIAIYRNRMLLASFAVTFATTAFVNFVRKAGEQEDSVRRLAMVFGGDGARALDKYSSELQKTTVFGDESTNVLMSQIGAFGANVEQTKQLTKATMDLAAGLNLDLNTAGLLVAKTIGSSTDALTRYGVGAQGATEKNQKIANVVASVETKFGGLAETLGKTTSGQLAQASNAFGDAAEQIGQVLAPLVLGLAKAFKFLAENLTAERMKAFATATSIAALAVGAARLQTIGFKNALIAAKTATLAFNSALKANKLYLIIAGLVAAGTAAIDYFDIFKDNQDEIDEFGRTTEEAALINQQHADKVKAANDSIQKKIDLLKAQSEIEKFAIENGIKITDVNKDLFESYQNELKILEDLKDKEEGRNALRKESIKFASDLADSFLESSNAQMNAVKEQQSFELEQLRNSQRYLRSSDKQKKKLEDEVLERNKKNMDKAFKDNQNARIGQAVIDTYGGMTRALNDHAMPFAAIIATLVGAMGFRNVQQIKAQQAPKFAYGGLVGGNLHSQGGTMIEAERGEFVVSRRGVDAVGVEALNRINSGSSAAINISFQGNVLSKDFIEDEAIPQIKEAIRRGADIGVS